MADDTLRREWGTPAGPAGPNVATLAPCGDRSCLATVTFANTLIWSGAPGGEEATVTLTLDGLDVVVTVESRPGRTVDTVTVVPPMGYLAEPAWLDVEEDASGVVRIVAALVG